MIQDIIPHIYHNEYRPCAPTDKDVILYYQNRTVLVQIKGDTFIFPTFKDVKQQLSMTAHEYTYLFAIDDINYYLVPQLNPEWLPAFTFEDIVLFRNSGPKEKCFALITGFQLNSWYKSRRFCGACGTALVQDTRERMLMCPNCKATEYPKISPAVIIAVRNKDKLLLSKYAGRNAKRYALIAGFTEIGETLEETVHREVMEEVGLKVKNIQYYKSQPWSLSGTILAGFYCDLDGEDRITLDEEELATAQWFQREEIPYDDYDVSLTREMMIQFKKGLF